MAKAKAYESYEPTETVEGVAPCRRRGWSRRSAPVESRTRPTRGPSPPHRRAYLRKVSARHRSRRFPSASSRYHIVSIEFYRAPFHVASRVRCALCAPCLAWRVCCIPRLPRQDFQPQRTSDGALTGTNELRTRCCSPGHGQNPYPRSPCCSLPH